jgi:FMN-dependent NADH-azoreductase
VLGEPKHGSGSVPQWKTGGARYPAVYRALLEEHSGSKLARVNLENQRIPEVDERLHKGKAKRRQSDPLSRPVRNQ